MSLNMKMLNTQRKVSGQKLKLYKLQIISYFLVILHYGLNSEQ